MEHTITPGYDPDNNPNSITIKKRLPQVHCLFEQSGTFKNEFKKIGIPAFDYDIQNNFQETDYQRDLFVEIEKGYRHEESIFDKISSDDLILAFFPCIYFTGIQTHFFELTSYNLKNNSKLENIEYAIDRIKKRNDFHILLYKLLFISYDRNLKLIIENPATGSYIIGTQNFIKPTFIDKDRTLRGDFFKKPTAYWFINIKPTYGLLSQKKDKITKNIMASKKGKKAGICSMERSLISSDYARNFIHDYILGTPQIYTQQTLWKDI